MSGAKTDPLAMPAWLRNPADRHWWTSITEAIRLIQAEADENWRNGQSAHFQAEKAALDYGRLKREYRDRWMSRGLDEASADIRFSGLQVTRDCIADEQMYRRFAQERLVAANAGYQQVARLMEQAREFLAVRRPKVPAQRVGHD